MKGTDRLLYIVVWRIKRLIVDKAEWQKQQELKSVVETSTLSVRVNTSSDVSSKSV